jgi:hypothetical protein
MAYTTVDQVSAMLPTFARGNAQQAPTDPNIQIWINDVAGEINAVLQRRFWEAICAPPYAGMFAAWVAALPAEPLAILEKINRFGAAAQLLTTLATIGTASTAKLAQVVESRYSKMWNDLNARDGQGRPMASGLYDFYFDPLSRVESPRPGLQAIAGGDLPKGQVACDVGVNMLFSLEQVI